MLVVADMPNVILWADIPAMVAILRRIILSAEWAEGTPAMMPKTI
jgi:hypothetical protein